VERILVDIGIYRDRFDIQFFARPDNPYRDFSPVRNQDFIEKFHMKRADCRQGKEVPGETRSFAGCLVVPVFFISCDEKVKK
jgi:hypothetical protein